MCFVVVKNKRPRKVQCFHLDSATTLFSRYTVNADGQLLHNQLPESESGFTSIITEKHPKVLILLGYFREAINPLIVNNHILDTSVIDLLFREAITDTVEIKVTPVRPCTYYTRGFNNEGMRLYKDHYLIVSLHKNESTT